jgi:23S rRNA (uracil1939-C5)-methyltransferase
MIELSLDAMAHGGEAIGRLDGKAVFVAGAIPGDRAMVEVVLDRERFARARLSSIVEPSPFRTDPPCRHFPDCGGCQWQMAQHQAQLGWKAEILVGQLRHLGGVADPSVRPTLSPGPPFGYRNRMDFSVMQGRPALLEAKSSRAVALEVCHLMAPPVAEMFDRLGRLDGIFRLTLRAGIATGDQMVVVDGRAPAALAREATRRSINEVVGGVTFRVSSRAFFQANTDGAEALVGLVAEALGPTSNQVMLDAFAGGGLFSLTVGRRAGRVVAVESDPAALGDLRHNAKGAVAIEDLRFEEYRGEAVDIAVCDPPRTGLGAAGVEALTAARPEVVAYVSCDPASLSRDVRLLAAHGYRLDWAQPVDMFPQTFHVETVARLVRN